MTFEPTPSPPADDLVLKRGGIDQGFRRLADALPQIVWVVDSQGRHLFHNQRWETFTGRSSNDSLGHGWKAVVHPADHNLTPATSTPTPRPVTLRLHRHDGVYLAFDLTYQPWPPGSDAPKTWLALATEARLATTIIDQAPASLYIYELPTRRLIRSSGRPIRSLGYTDEEVSRSGLDFFNAIIHPDDVIRWAEHLKTLEEMPDGAEIPFEYRMKDTRGLWRWFISRESVLERDAESRVMRVLGAAIEVTGRVGIEDLFQLESEVTDLAMGEVNYVNDTIRMRPEALEMLGLPRDQTIIPRSTIQSLIHEDDRPLVLAEIERSLNPSLGGRFVLEHRIVWPNGEIRWHRVREKIFFNEGPDGEVRPYRGVLAIRDISATKRYEEALLQTDNRFRSFCKSDIIGIIFGDIHGGIQYANDEYLRILGYSRDEFEAGRIRWNDVTPPEWLSVDERAIQEAKARGGPSSRYEKEYIRKDGSRIPVLVGFTIYGSSFEETIAYILDISEQKKSEHLLLEADRRKDEFLAMLAHELRNPLAALSNAVKLLAQPDLDDLGRLWADEVANRQLKNLVRIIDDLLDVSRIRSGKIQLRKEELDLTSVVATAVESARPLIEARRHRLEVQVEADSIPIYGDPTRLEQILANLLNNAAKYTDEGGQIQLNGGILGNEAFLRVTDNGMGIDSAMIPIIFDLFAQVDNSLDRAHGGLGIGLSLVKSLANMHGGSVKVDSAGIGQGSQFEIRLPLLLHPLARALTTPAPPAPVTRTHKRVLVVDDNIDSLKGLVRLLSRAGHEVQMAADGPAAVFSTLEFDPDIVLLDIGLPGMNGYEVAETLRAKGVNSVLVALSGYSQERDRERSKASGFDHHLSKPTDVDDLLDLISQAQRRVSDSNPA